MKSPELLNFKLVKSEMPEVRAARAEEYWLMAIADGDERSIATIKKPHNGKWTGYFLNWYTDKYDELNDAKWALIKLIIEVSRLLQFHLESTLAVREHTDRAIARGEPLPWDTKNANQP